MRRCEFQSLSSPKAGVNYSCMHREASAAHPFISGPVGVLRGRGSPAPAPLRAPCIPACRPRPYPCARHVYSRVCMCTGARARACAREHSCARARAHVRTRPRLDPCPRPRACSRTRARTCTCMRTRVRMRMACAHASARADALAIACTRMRTRKGTGTQTHVHVVAHVHAHASSGPCWSGALLLARFWCSVVAWPRAEVALPHGRLAHVGTRPHGFVRNGVGVRCTVIAQSSMFARTRARWLRVVVSMGQAPRGALCNSAAAERSVMAMQVGDAPATPQLGRRTRG